MNITNARLGALFIGAAWIITAGLPAQADDTELFVATSTGANIRPNVLFVIDNSGSMSTTVTTQEPFDPMATYTGDCLQTRVYWRSQTGDMPTCKTQQYIEKTALHCKAALTAFATGGQFIDKLAQYDPDTTGGWNGDTGQRWEVLDRNFHDRAVECLEDSGVHGSDDDDLNLYPRDGATTNGYWGNQSQRMRFNQTHNNRSYTLYSANYMNWIVSSTTTKTRLRIVQDVATQLINAINGVNVGLMYFNDSVDGLDSANLSAGSQGGLVAHAMQNVAEPGARAAINGKINALTPETLTPLSETLYEASLYYNGRDIRYGTDSVAAARVPGNTDRYASPITDTCQQNYIVFLTDGAPTSDTDATLSVQAMNDQSSPTVQKFGDLTGDTVSGATCDQENGVQGACFDDLAEFMYLGDNSPLPDSQPIRTYTIGFTVNLPVLEQAATRGGGRYYQANDTATLANALTNILIEVLETNQTFSSPSVSVNAFNRTQNLSDLFISVFRPSGTRHWHGNLKKYRLSPSSATIVDANGVPAIENGFFKTSAQSYWSSEVDGRNVVLGGAAHEMPIPADRKIYTYLDQTTNLWEDSNLVTASNTTYLTDARLDISGITGEPTRAEVIRYIRGEDFEDWNGNNNFNDNREQMGDPLHSTPTSVIYGPGQRDGLLFFATNDGVLHALDLEDGTEKWAFIPPEFLRHQILLYSHDITADKHYGIDGDLRVLQIGDNDNEIEPNEKVFVYFGMGRGGDFYYALDVTDKDRPVLKWKATPGTLPHLGESWSTPVPTRIDIQGATYDAANTDKHVLVIGGGYDPDQDFETFSKDLTRGNAIYIVDAYSGNLLWTASNEATTFPTKTQVFATANRAMEYSIPARIRVVDFDGDGKADRFYAGDMGGQIWRFDVRNGKPATELVAGGVIAQLGGAPSDPVTAPADTLRRFYYAPDVASVNTRTENFVHIGIGSGHRGHPLNMTNHDRFFALRDSAAAVADQAAFDTLYPSPITDANLEQITTTNTTLTTGKRGWYLDLDVGTGWAGEKVLAEARTFNNQVIFSTFRPGNSGIVTCTPQLGTNRVYQLNIFNGAPVTNLDTATTGALTMSDMYIQNAGGILSTAQALFVDSDSDGDGTPDAEEDADGDGIPDEADPDFVPVDLDNNGIPDSEDPDADLDNDNIPNRLDPDDDGDGILDIDEEDDKPVICVGLICFPAGFTNTPVRTFWSQESVD